MTTTTDVVNRALQAMGSRTTVASLVENSNEAIQANLILQQVRDQLLRMAPWDCANNYNSLVYITSTPGTPENITAGTTLWQKGQPPPPWAYEYQYPSDCLRALFIVPQSTTGFSSGVPITTAVTGGVPTYWNGPPVRFKVSVDQFFSVTSVSPAAAGSGYVVGDIIILAGTPAGQPPIGTPAVLQVLGVSGGGGVTSASVIPSIANESVGGSYFAEPTNPVAQGSTFGAGTGATFNCNFQFGDQRVILTNQENALLNYVRQIVDPNVMDPLFLEAWVQVLAARLSFQLSGDKALANLKIQEANAIITEARKVDGNEGLTVNDVTPDWIRIRGIEYPVWEFSPNLQFDWGPMFTPY